MFLSGPFIGWKNYRHISACLVPLGFKPSYRMAVNLGVIRWGALGRLIDDFVERLELLLSGKYPER